MVVVDKPVGPTSHDVVDAARRAWRERRIGHAGTLDPFASGVLPLCLGPATRLARFLGGDKEYRATVRLGFATTTDDRTGRPIGTPRAVDASRAAVEDGCRRLTGALDQVPPAFSAKHVGGRRAHELARAGVAVEAPPVQVTVHAIEVLSVEGDRVVIHVRCSAGTYVRALARDLGAALGVGGHLEELRRVRSGPFGLEASVGLGDVGRPEALLTPSRALGHLPELRLGPADLAAVRHGRDLPVADLPGPAGTVDGPLRLVDEQGTLVAVGECRVLASGRTVVHPDVVLVA